MTDVEKWVQGGGVTIIIIIIIVILLYCAECFAFLHPVVISLVVAVEMSANNDFSF